MSTSVLSLSRVELEALPITTDDVVERIEQLILGQGDGTVWNAPKIAVVPPDERYLMATLAACDDPPYMAVKSLLQNPRNPARGLPTINALVTLLHGETGVPLATIDGNWVTAVRTAGLSAVAARRLARPDSASLAFIGCGVQAHSHLDALAALFPLTEVRAFGRGALNRDALCAAARERGLEARASVSAEDAIRGADMVVTSVTCPPALEPFLDAGWLSPGAFAAVTDRGPWQPQSMVELDRIIIDDMAQEALMDEPMVAPELVSGDLTGLVTGAIASRQNADERTAFVFRGLALGDLALAALAYESAVVR